MLTSASTQLSARELELSVGQRLGVESNVLRRENNEKDDGFWEFAPQLTLRELRNDELSYSLRYRPRYRQYFDVSGINGWDHAQTAMVGWQITPRDNLSIDQSYTSTRTRRVDGGDADLDASDRDRVKRARADVDYSHGFTQRFFGNIGLSFEDYAFDSDERIDNHALGGSLGVTYGVFERTTVGLSALGRYRNNRGDNRSRVRQPSSNNYVFNLAASASQAVTPTIDFFLQIGPSIIYTDPDGLSTEGSTTEVTFFATTSLAKRFRLGELSAAYTRSESGGAGATSSQILDAVDLEATYQPYPDWRVRVIGRWSRQEVASDIEYAVFTGNPPVFIGFAEADRKLDRYRVITSLNHRLTDRFSAQLRFDYTRQKEEGFSAGSGTRVTRDVEIYSGFVGVEYTFDPWVF
jgi:hypothetical protein